VTVCSAPPPLPHAMPACRSRSSPPEPRTTSPAAPASRSTRRGPAASPRRGVASLNTASIGLSVRAAQQAQPWKPRLGRLAYAAGAFEAGLRAKPVTCRLLCEGEELFAGPAWQTIVANTGRFGAGSSVAIAEPDDGLLDAVVVPAVARAVLPRYALAMRRGALTSIRAVRHCRAARVRLEVPRPERFNVDGEIVERGPVDFEVERAVVRFVVG
jgi:diacylglycerol kinase (ATP)